jgi:hypothetical protein
MGKQPIIEWEIYMLKKYLIFTPLFCVFVLPRLFGANVSCLVIETGLPSEGTKSQYSTTWENNLMDVFFDTGHIVSNARMIRLDRKPAENFPGAAERDYQEARANGMEYFLIAIIEQNKTVSLRLFSTNSQKLIKEQVYTDNKPASAKEENESIKRTINLIAAQIR